MMHRVARCAHGAVLAALVCVAIAALPTLASGEPLATPSYMEGHNFTFVIGTHHSGTTILDLLLCEHNEISCLKHTHAPMDEGQHLQDVYVPAYKAGGMLRFGFHPQNHLTADSPLITPQNQRKLFDAWKPFWDLSKPILLEKSPPDVLKTQFFQSMFGTNTKFLLTMRHPLACVDFIYRPRKRATEKWHARRNALTQGCGAQAVEHWLVIHDTLRQDAKHVNNLAVYQYENFLNTSKEVTQGYVREMMEFLGMSDTIHIEFEDEIDPDLVEAEKLMDRQSKLARIMKKNGDSISPAVRKYIEEQTHRIQTKVEDEAHISVVALGKDAGPSANHPDNMEVASTSASTSLPTTQEEQHGNPSRSRQVRDTSSAAVSPKQRRKLAEFHGSRKHVLLKFGQCFGWIKHWEAVVDMQSNDCKALIHKYEARVNEYGYSLKDLTSITVPTALFDNLLTVEHYRKEQAHQTSDHPKT
eukprot:m.362388 g.362388  ORF g.362388 m.362388 type:complete len:471 (-) comp20435_c0_seq1:207-1619(-)